MSYSILCRWGGGAAPPNPPFIFFAPHLQARPSSVEQENLATLSKKRHVLILLDVLQMGVAAPPNPSAHFFGNF